MSGAVLVWNSSTQARSIPKDLRDVIDGSLRVYHIQDPWQWPQGKTVDFYVYRTDDSAVVQRAANSMGALAVYLGRKKPNAEEWLRAQIKARCAAGQDVYIFSASKVGDRMDVKV